MQCQLYSGFESISKIFFWGHYLAEGSFSLFKQYYLSKLNSILGEATIMGDIYALEIA